MQRRFVDLLLLLDQSIPCGFKRGFRVVDLLLNRFFALEDVKCVLECSDEVIFFLSVDIEVKV